jgi:hypothetical protein
MQRGMSSLVTVVFPAAATTAVVETDSVRVLHKWKRLRGAKHSLIQLKEENGVRGGAPHRGRKRHDVVDLRRGSVDGFLGPNPGQGSEV